MPNEIEENDLHHCSSCSDELQEHEEHYSEDLEEVLCENCYNDSHVNCNSCDCSMWNESEYVHYHDSDAYCQECYYDSFSSCDGCGDWFAYDTLRDNEEGERFCRNCYRPSNNIIHRYGYKPNADFHVGKNELPYNNSKDMRLVFGFELEVEYIGNGDIYEVAEKVQNIFPTLIYLKEDGSLSNGFEIVSHPMTIDYFKENKKRFESLLQFCKDNDLRSYDTDSCGLHISVCKQHFTPSHYLKFVDFFQQKKNAHFLTKVSQRKETNLRRWANIGRTHSRIDVMKYCKDKSIRSGKYHALNLGHRTHCEIRIFRGTLKSQSFFKAFEVILAIVDFTKQVSFAMADINRKKSKFAEQLIEENKKRFENQSILNVSNELIKKRWFNTFISLNKNLYKNLDNFMSEKMNDFYKIDSSEEYKKQLINKMRGN